MKHWIHIGTQKAGSTFLYGLVAQIPDVAIARKQELNFFTHHQDQSYEAYLSCFPEKRPVLFDNSPIYFREGAKTAPAIAAILGDKPLLLSLILRDPVDAIVSLHEMRLQQGFFVRRKSSYSGDPRDLSAFVRANPGYLDVCRYMDLLETHWLPHFAASRFAIHIFEEFTASPLEAVRGLAERAGVSDIGQLDSERVWKNARPATGFAHWLVTTSSRNPALRALGRKTLAVPALRRVAEGALFKKPGGSAQDQLKLAETKAELVENLRPQVARLQEFLGRDRLPWRNFFGAGTGGAHPPLMDRAK
jgi:hypothetical protein